MNTTTTLYRKVGKRYVKHDNYFDNVGLPEGLYLIYKNGNAMMNMLNYAKVHEIQNVGKFCDLFVAHKDTINKALGIAMKKCEFSISDLTKQIIAELSKIED